MIPFILTAGRNVVELPMHDPIVHAHVNAPRSMVSALLGQINCQETYRFAFGGRKNMTFLDLGANMGLVSLYAHDVCSRIVAVEPDPYIYPVLEAISRHFPIIEPVCAAVNDADCEVPFHINHMNTTANSVVNTAGVQIKVNGLSLTTILKSNRLENVDLCKVDIEGSEGISLSKEELENAKPIIQAYYIETHNCPKTTWEYKLGQLVSIFSTIGYRDMKIDGMAIYAKRT
jgi:FkbM family methyltransferase